MDRPLITIIVPVYNTEKYLRQCLESIRLQTWENLEILLLDDGSPDRCGSICDQYALSDSRFKVFHFDHIGVSAIRNYGVEHAHGQWIGFVDSDDWIEPDMFKVLVQTAISFNATVSVCGHYREYVNKTETVAHKGTCFLCGQDEIIKGFYVEHLLTSNMCTKLYAREFFDLGIRFPTGKSCEDIFILTDIFLNVTKLAYIGIPLYHYRIREGSTVNRRCLQIDVDFWRSRFDRYNKLRELPEDYSFFTIRDCLSSIKRIWRDLYYTSKEEKEFFKQDISDMSQFSRSYCWKALKSDYSIQLKITAFVSRFNCLFSYWFFHIISQVYLLLENINKKKKIVLFPN